MNLQIQCPKCAKRFTVHEDLTGKTVECGACDHRFPVKSEAIIAERSKVYPGEQKRDDFLNRLGRDPSMPPAQNIPSREMRGSTPKVDSIMPTSAGQNMAAATGVIILALYLLTFFMGTSEGGIFQDFDEIKRYVLGGFVSVLGAGMILFGAKNWRGKAIILSLCLVAGVFALIFIRPVHLTPKVGDFPDLQDTLGKTQTPDEAALDDEDLKELVGYSAMERQFEAMSERFEGDPSDYLVGIFIRGLKSSQYHSIEKYFQAVLKIPITEGVHRYTRNSERDSLIVISGLKLDFDAVVRACDPRLGRATTYPELRLIDLKLSALHDAKPSDDLRKKLSDPYNPSFFTANLGELGVLDPLRVKDAIGQLSRVPPDVELRYRDQIAEALMGLVSLEADPLVLSDLGNALRIWAKGDQAAFDLISRRVEKSIQEKKDVPASFMNFLIENKAQTSPRLLDLLWSEDPEAWMEQYLALGSGAEPRMIEHLEGTSLRLRNAATFILATIGTEKSLARLERFQTSEDDEFRFLIERAIKAIKSR